MIGNTDVLLANVQSGESLAYNSPYDNLRLGALSAALRGQNLEVEHFDSTEGEASLGERVFDLAPRAVVVFDTLYRVSEDVVRAISFVRRARPGVRVLLVGRAADAVSREPTVSEFVDAIYDSSDLEAIAADCLAHRGERQLSSRFDWATITPERPFRALSQRRGVLDVEATKGCAYSCSFCAVDGIAGGPRRKAWRPRPAADVVSEIVSLTGELGVTRVQFVDDNFLGAPRAAQWALDFVEELHRQHVNIAFSCYARLDHVLDSVLEPLVAAGLVQVHAGVESGSAAVLRRLRKGTTPNGLAAMIDRVRGAGVELVTSLIVFEPRMTLAELEESLLWLKANRLERSFSLSTLIPFEASLAYAELSDLLLPQPHPQSFGALGYSFTDGGVDEIYRAAVRTEQRRAQWLSAMMRVRFQQEELFGLTAVGEDRTLSHLDAYRRRQIDLILNDIERARR